MHFLQLTCDAIFDITIAFSEIWDENKSKLWIGWAEEKSLQHRLWQNTYIIHCTSNTMCTEEQWNYCMPIDTMYRIMTYFLVLYFLHVPVEKICPRLLWKVESVNFAVLSHRFFPPQDEVKMIFQTEIVSEGTFP